MKPSLGALLDRQLKAPSRILLVVAALCLVPMYVAPLWNMTMFAPQYPDGLRLDIYSHKLEGGNHGQDIKEINLLNHYIGMRDLVAEDFTEFKWMPFAIGGLILLFLRAVVFGKIYNLVDVTALFGYFGLFALWSFVYKLYRYGHNLAHDAAVKVPPFTPPIFGHTKMANFDVYSYPALASYAMMVSGVALAAALFFGLRDALKATA
ncbi:MAG TPA: hypothetical protein VF334_11120 [Polyangia bacterium]